jgi:tRNA A-37 threonylcarbamoyl transferase component Bud32
VASTNALTDRLLGGRYRLGAILGRGGMAEVYDGFDERLDRPVAVKVLRPDMAAREDVRRRFEDEARSAARLVHPNVVSVFDSGEDGTVEFLVMERLPGETMADRMAAAAEDGGGGSGSGRLDADWVLRVAGDVLLALGAAHDAGIVHRDVKPGNVLLAADGCAKVADFGIAKSLEVAAGGDLTSTNQLLGTPAYVAPERIEGRAATVRSDLYAVGVLLYEAFAGVKPFRGNTAVATAYAIRHETPPPLGDVRPDLPGPVVGAVERAMARDPSERFASAAELAAALGVAGPGGAGGAGGVPPQEDATTVLPVSVEVRGAPAASGMDETMLGATAVPATATLVAGVEGGGGGGSRAGVAGALRGAWSRGGALDDRRRLLLVAVVAALVALVLLALAVGASGGGDGAVSPARKDLAADLRSAADDEAAAPASDALDDLAGKVEDGEGGPEATRLLGQLVAWRDAGELTPATADSLAGLVRRVPGVDANAYTAPTTTTAAPPPTEPPERTATDGKGKGRRKHDD